MDIKDVPQEGNATLGGGRKAMYAKDSDGAMVIVSSRGWEVEEIVTQQAVDILKQLANEALTRARSGHASPLEFWMYHKRMDLMILAQSTGLWRWQVSRHLQPAHFANLSEKLLGTYADALGLSITEIKSLPQK